MVSPCPDDPPVEADPEERFLVLRPSGVEEVDPVTNPWRGYTQN